MKIGVDGGGTKTELILIDQNGAIVARHLAPGCSPSHVGPERARETLTEALRKLLSKTHSQERQISRTLLCMAGSQDFWREFALSLTGYGYVEATTDASPVLELAAGGQAGLVLHTGTGSFVALNDDDGVMHYAGGFGWRLGDPGSSLDIGRRAASRALSELQGWTERTLLSEALTELLSTDKTSAITAALHRSAEPNQLLGSFAACVSQLAAKGDQAALAVILASVGDLVACAEAAAGAFIKNYSIETIPAGVSGAILTQPFVIEALRSRTRLPLKPLSDSPIEGVRRMLLKRN